jgi:hypothetical protein
MSYEYAVVPAPKKGLKARGVKTTEDRFAYALQTIMNEYGREGWEYVRTDTLPSEERSGFTGRTTVFQNMMVFRKPLAAAEPPAALLAPPEPAPLTAPAAPEVAPVPSAAPMPAPDHMMSVDNRPLATDPARTEPKLSAD